VHGVRLRTASGSPAAEDAVDQVADAAGYTADQIAAR
jgi:hypothetical protein